MIDWAQLTLFLYVMARMNGLVLFNPILGRRDIPGVFRAGFVLALSVFAVSVVRTKVEIPNTLFGLAAALLSELALGFVLGMVVNFFFYIPQLAGSIVDTQMGMTMNQIYDAASQANMSTTGVLLNILMMLLFFAANGHHTMLRIFLTAEGIVPFGHWALTAPVLNGMLALFVECTVLGIKMCMPILAAELIAQLGMGILMKVIPQINVFSINLELKIIIGLSLLLLLIAPFGEFLLGVERTMLDSLSEILHLAAN